MSDTKEAFARYPLPRHGSEDFPRLMPGEWHEATCAESETVRDPLFETQCVWSAQADKTPGTYGGKAVFTCWGNTDWTRPLVADLRPYNSDGDPLPCLHMIYVLEDDQSAHGGSRTPTP